jgi:threonine aldolase
MINTAVIRGFGSDNHAGIHPEILAAIAEANAGHVHSYGGDPYTERMVAQFRRHFGEQAEVFPMFNGSGANVVSLAAMIRPWSSVICAASAHVALDESTAPELVAGCRILGLPTPDGKLTPELIEPHLVGFGFVHHAQPAAVVISQSSEYGTVYTPDEVRAIADLVHGHQMRLFMDGARLGNAAVALGAPFRAFTTDAGVDALTFGGTKNGLMVGDAAVLLDPDLAPDLPFIRKRATQLASKMRFLSCQFEALLAGDLWERNARNANAMAARLADAIRDVPGLALTQPVQANAVFATLPRHHIGPLQERAFFYAWDEARNEVRLMCAWDTTPEDVDAFAADIRQTLAS